MSVESSGHFRRAARGVLRWTMTYTRGLDPRVAASRQDEIASDLHEHAMWAAEAGVGAQRLAWSIRLRALRGAPADLIWRSAVLRQADPGVRLALRADAALAAAMVGERQRAWAALALAVPTGLILAETGRALYFLSASAVVLVNRLPWWEPATYAVGAALALACVSAAIHWLRLPDGNRAGQEAALDSEGEPRA